MPSTWVTPRVWVAGERVSASKMNEISTDLGVLYPYTTAGDISYRNASSAYLDRLAIGAAYKTLRSTGSVPEWGGYVAGKALRSTNQSINNNTATNVQFASTEYSTGVTWSSGDNTKLTITVTGLYLVGASYVIDGGSGYRQANILKNGSTAIIESRHATADTETTYLQLPEPVLLTAADYLQLQVTHNAGSAINVRDARLYAILLGV